MEVSGNWESQVISGIVMLSLFAGMFIHTKYVTPNSAIIKLFPELKDQV